MSLLKAYCPRCATDHVTFDITAQKSLGLHEAGWVEHFEAFAVCRHCHRSTVFVLENRAFDVRDNFRDHNQGVVKYGGYLNDHMKVRDYVSLKDRDREAPPEHIPDDLEKIYDEGSTCVSVRCWNAAGAMFRLVVDKTTKSMLPPDGEEPNAKIRRSLGLRLDWMFKNRLLPSDLEELADSIKEDGNDGAHDGTLTENEALDLRDFTFNLLERLYTAPKKLEIAAARRRERRGE
ncbi:DUF4145 domain-containing protein [Rhizobium sp. Rhizsp82]|uniref:DUF4145 domain-containing protein n=1 Tax=Rhizobium sp. Rhizsp82 TaxID=3243057 RepID=UPI0039B51724